MKQQLTAIGKSFLIPLISAITSFPVQAQQKATISAGPVMTVVKNKVVPQKVSSDGRLFTEQHVYFEKGDWLVAHGMSGNQLYILLFDLKEGKYIRAADDSLRLGGDWQGNLTMVIPRSDSFAIMFATKVDRGYSDEYYSSPIDTPRISYTVSTYRASASNPTNEWNFTERLSYLCNHWSAAFRAMPRQANPEYAKNNKPTVEYFPEIPVAVHDSMGASIVVMGREKRLAYIQYSYDMPYVKAKAFYDKLGAQLKSATDKVKVTDYDAPYALRRAGEMATSFYSLKVKAEMVPDEYTIRVEDAGKGFKYLPISLYLLGNKQTAKVMIIMGAQYDDLLGVSRD